jgi:hypothetical protein
MIWTLFVIFLGPQGEPTHYQPMEQYKKKMLCFFYADKLKQEESFKVKGIGPGIDNQIIINTDYACVASPPEHDMDQE